MSRLTLVLFFAAIVWFAFFEWLRHSSWLRHRDSGFSPGTQGLSLAASLGGFLLTLAAVLCFFFLPAR